jgi:hypothetical protein
MLNEQDQELFAKLSDPNQQSQVHYAWDEDFQRVVLGLLLCDRYFMQQSVGLIKKNYFTNEIHQAIAKVLFEYFDAHKQQPSKIFLKQELIDHLKVRYKHNEETYESMKLLYVAELNLVYDYYTNGGVGDMLPGLDSPEAIINKILAFAKTQAMRQAFAQSLALIRKSPHLDDTWVEVNEILNEARLVDRQSDIGLNYYETIDERYNRMQEEKESGIEVFHTGFEPINRGLDDGGLRRGEIGAYMALPGVGKSLALVQASVLNVSGGKKVLYITTEMDQDRVAKRFDCMTTSIGHNKLQEQREGVKRALLEGVRDYEDKRRLVIKQFPSGTADVNTFRAYYAQLGMWGFKPDLMIVDYIGDMKDFPGIPTWESRFRILRDLRGFGVESNHCTLTALQPNKSAAELKIEDFIDESKLADSFMQNRVLDAFWTINQTANEQKAEVGRIYVAKTRNGRSKFSFKIKYDFKDQTLRMSDISDDTYRGRMAKVSSKDSDATAEQMAERATRSFTPSEGERQ